MIELKSILLRGIFSLLELFIKKAEPSKWKPGTPSFDNAIVSILYVSHHQEKANLLFRIIRELGFKPQRINLNPTESDKELTTKMIKEAQESWASILIDPVNNNYSQIAHAFRNFAHHRQEVVTIVAGNLPSSFNVLDRYTHLTLHEDSESTYQEMTKALMKASLARIRHYKKMGTSFTMLFTVILLSFFLFGSSFGWWFGRNQAENALENVKTFDAALIETSLDNGKKREFVALAANRDDPEILNSEATNFKSQNGIRFSCKLQFIEFIDKLVQSEHKFGALCPANRNHEGESQYVSDNLSLLLKKIKITKHYFDSLLKNKLIEKLEEFRRPPRGERKHLPTVLFVRVTCESNSGSANDNKKSMMPKGKWDVQPGSYIETNNNVIIMAFEGSQIKFSNKEVFTVKRISRASTKRLCGLE